MIGHYLHKHETHLFLCHYHIEYQYGCKGRHIVRHVVSGSVIPILNTMLGGISTHDDDRQLFKVVRVETSNKPNQADLLSASKSSDTEVDLMNVETAPNLDAIKIGQGVAFEMKSLGSSVLRGEITKVNGMFRLALLLHFLSCQTNRPANFNYLHFVT